MSKPTVSAPSLSGIAALCKGTPSVRVIDNRGLAVRGIQYNREAADGAVDERITRLAYSPAGYGTSCIDPRLHDSGAIANARFVRSLSGRALHARSQDAGDLSTLFDSEGGQRWQRNGRGIARRQTFDLLHRPDTVREIGAGDDSPRISERYLYGDTRPAGDGANLRGQLSGHYDTAGLLTVCACDLRGQPLARQRRLLLDAEADSDWQGDGTDTWDRALDDTVYLTRNQANALGDPQMQTDAAGNRQRRHYDIAGRPDGHFLTLAGGSEQTLLASATHDASGQRQTEVAGNGVTTAYAYEPRTRRLIAVTVGRPAQEGRPARLLALEYSYDPVGNPLRVANAAAGTRFHRNRAIEPYNEYSYDALYQLLSASGTENAGKTAQDTGLPVPLIPLPDDDTVLTGYTRQYLYDRGGNLTSIRHQSGAGPAAGYTLDMVVSDRANQAVRQTGGLTPADVAASFDACGNLLALTPGQPLSWNSRNRLARVSPVNRTDGNDDRESYQYGGDGLRVRKTRITAISGGTRTAEVIYLPGLELRTTRSNARTDEAWQSIVAGDARVLHWTVGQPTDIDNDQYRYLLAPPISALSLELDRHADLLTAESYYPYGGTASWAARSRSEADHKVVRYSGKTRDATGLYDYGYRHYAPWLGRWISPDPAGLHDGINLFRMAHNNPVRYRDSDGRITSEEQRDRDNAFDYMQSRGSYWREHDLNIHDMNDVLEDNYQALLKEVQSGMPLPEEADFVARFSDLGFHAVHATNTDWSGQNEIHLLSRKALIAQGIPFPTANTQSVDLQTVATDDFVFFSFELTQQQSKPISRFGKIAYRFDIEQHPRFASGIVSLFDPAIPEKPDIRKYLPELSEESYQQLATRLTDLKNNIFNIGPRGQDISRTIALAIVNELRMLTNIGDRKKLLSLKTPEELNRLMNSLYRPQILVPRKFTAPQGSFTAVQLK